MRFWKDRNFASTTGMRYQVCNLSDGKDISSDVVKNVPDWSTKWAVLRGYVLWTFSSLEVLWSKVGIREDSLVTERNICSLMAISPNILSWQSSCQVGILPCIWRRKIIRCPPGSHMITSPRRESCRDTLRAIYYRELAAFHFRYIQ